MKNKQTNPNILLKKNIQRNDDAGFIQTAADPNPALIWRGFGPVQAQLWASAVPELGAIRLSHSSASIHSPLHFSP